MTLAGPVEPPAMRRREIDILPNEAPLKLDCNWKVGIGGDLWTSGDLLVSYFRKHQTQLKEVFDHRRILELGSGTGYVGLAASMLFEPEEMLLTDLESHVSILQRNVDLNALKATVEAYAWGRDTIRRPYDIILGTDVAYLDELHTPLVQALVNCSDHKTLIFLGINRDDTDVTFFHQLDRAGFHYVKISDALYQEHGARAYGLFKITRR